MNVYEVFRDLELVCISMYCTINTVMINNIRMKIKLTNQKGMVFSRSVNTKMCKTKRHRTLYIKILQSHQEVTNRLFFIL